MISVEDIASVFFVQEAKIYFNMIGTLDSKFMIQKRSGKINFWVTFWEKK